MPKIYIKAPGFRIDGLHTKTEFLRIVQNEFSDRLYRRMKGDPPGVPIGKIKKDDLKSWMKLVGAKLI
jgi:hypothetical protein